MNIDRIEKTCYSSPEDGIIKRLRVSLYSLGAGQVKN